MHLTVSIDELAEAWVLTARGDLDYAESAAFRMRADQVVRAAPAALVVDLSEVDYFDSSGLGILLSLAQEYRAVGGRMVLVASETVESILQITRLTEVFALEADANTALATLRRTAPPG